jgi:hypothetical protein
MITAYLRKKIKIMMEQAIKYGQTIKYCYHGTIDGDITVTYSRGVVQCRYPYIAGHFECSSPDSFPSG